MRLIQRSDGVWPVIQKLIIIGMCLVTVLPLLWMVTTSFKEPLDIFALPPKVFFKPTLANYPDSMSRTDVIPRYKNTLIVAVSTSVLCMLLGSLSGYALARTKFRGAGLLSYLILASRLFPPIVIVVPMFTIFRRLGLIDTHLGLVIAYSSFVLPYVVWLMRGYFKELPDGIDECALIDGCTPFGAFEDRRPLFAAEHIGHNGVCRDTVLERVPFCHGPDEQSSVDDPGGYNRAHA